MFILFLLESIPIIMSYFYKGLVRKTFRFLPFVLGMMFALVVGCYSSAQMAKSTEILWDTYGIPHIYGKDAQNAFQAFGWAQMRSSW
jgi:acyl-homoserine-lactone acylase